ncbi:hypothetical protein QYE76_058867 [Lolium multiflorum]|uniref:Uncharacterized protein n=1 Tax=Lolium multiflorum TaxID=4521 RepID=A0AAD8T6A8_LOLMU|nr:hypothetical protein QYE76_058867 [Lolium multiflorum]
MVSADVARSVVGIVGNVISFGLFLSPVPTFWDHQEEGRGVQPDAYLVTFLLYAPNRKRLWVLAVLAAEAVLMAALVTACSSAPTRTTGGLLDDHALIKFDLYITIPNGLSVLFSVTQLILYGCY